MIQRSRAVHLASVSTLLFVALACSRMKHGTAGNMAASASSRTSSATPIPSLGAPWRGREPGVAPATSAVAPPPSVERGEELYRRMCAVCHGAKGEGYRADAAPALSQPDFLGSVDDAFLDFAIAIGRARTPMSSWRQDQGGPLSPWDIQSIIAFMRTWPHERATLDESFSGGDAERGKSLFVKHCDKCHGAHGTAVHITSRQWLVNAKTPFIRYSIARGRAPTPMKGYADTLGHAGVEDVLAYLRSLPSWLVPGEIAGTSRPPPIPLGPVPLNPHGPEPREFRKYPAMTSLAVVWRELARHSKMVIIDARAPSDYGVAHIAGAVSVPFYDPTPYLEALPKNVWLVCYCECPHAESGALAKQLTDAGFTKVTVLDEGFRPWIAAGHPTSTGTSP